MLLFDSFEQTKLETQELKSQLQQLHELKQLQNNVEIMSISDTNDSSHIDATRYSQCGVKLFIGETYYHCRTCTTRNNSVLCMRCYRGTNHIGHDVLTRMNQILEAWCDCGDMDYWKVHLNCKYHSSNGPSQCGARIAVGEKYYHCRTCTTSNISVLCTRCYQGTNHNGHDVAIKMSKDARIWCDCGDQDYWKVHLNCKHHH
ncbi:putative zinc finger in N-recognin-domain-containing protein [Glomus cerebriforme]|uniref:E3 ubiquitin-protein ligase n=1 Tax=Glomus cerebriforme TaxID=658196 RepID=A0A397TA23_9GLOM|nr:putative zinc finger in N-recognin-domain-containing protein [Glomus cerebriforme]